jgi:hypothetical protein
MSRLCRVTWERSTSWIVRHEIGGEWMAAKQVGWHTVAQPMRLARNMSCLEWSAFLCVRHPYAERGVWRIQRLGYG